MSSAIIGICAALLITYAAITTTTTSYLTYVNILGLVIVVGGTFSAAAISYNLRELFRIFSTVLRVLTRSREKQEEAVTQILDLAAKRQKGEPLGIKHLDRNQYHPFILDGVRLLENEFPPEQIEDILVSAVTERKSMFTQDIEVVSTLAKYPPAFGMIGTVLGLVALLKGLGGDESAVSIGPNMSVALLTTLYGLLFANYFFIPITDNLTNRLKAEMHFRKIIIKGILLLSQNQDYFAIKEVLSAHVLPDRRKRITDAMGSGSRTDQNERKAA